MKIYLTALLFLTLTSVTAPMSAFAENGFEASFQAQVEKIESGKLIFSNFFLLIQNKKTFQYKSPLQIHDLLGEYLPRILKGRSVGDKEIFLRQYLDKNNSEKMDAETKLLYESNLKKILNLTYGEKNAQVFLNPTCTPSSTPPAQGLEKLLGQLKNFEATVHCREFKTGSTMVVDGMNDTKTLRPAYSLEKESEKKYVARVSFQFHAGPRAAVTPEELEARVKICFKKAAPFLKGPSGEILELQNVTPSELENMPEEKRPPVSKVDIDAADVRSDTNSFKSNADCPTLIHETFHILGLSDEYKEEWIYNTYDPVTGKVSRKADAKTVFNYNCRVVSKVSSIMKNHYDRWNEIVEQPSEPPKALLHKNEFERVVGGLCPEKAVAYSRCARFAYTTDPMGECKDVPTECNDENSKYYLGDE